MTWYAWLMIGAYILLTIRFVPIRLVAARLANDTWSVAHMRSTWSVLATAALFASAYRGWIPWLAATLCPATLGAFELLNRPESRQVCGLATRKIRSFRTASSSLFLIVVGILAWHYWLSDSPYAHPRIRAAEALSQQVEQSRGAVELQLVTMHGRLDSLSTSLGDEGGSLDEIRRLTGELIVLVDQIAEDYAELVRLRDQAAGLVRETDAPARFREAARIWHQYALAERTEGYAELAERYEEIAQLWEAYAVAVERQRDKPLNVEVLQETIRYVGRARLLLGRLDAHIDKLPVSEALGRQTELEQSLRLFVQKFDSLRQNIRGLTTQLRKQATDPGQPVHRPLKKPQSPPRKVAAVRRTTPATPTTVSHVAEPKSPEISPLQNRDIYPRVLSRWFECPTLTYPKPDAIDGTEANQHMATYFQSDGIVPLGVHSIRLTEHDGQPPAEYDDLRRQKYWYAMLLKDHAYVGLALVDQQTGQMYVHRFDPIRCGEPSQFADDMLFDAERSTWPEASRSLDEFTPGGYGKDWLLLLPLLSWDRKPKSMHAVWRFPLITHNTPYDGVCVDVSLSKRHAEFTSILHDEDKSPSHLRCYELKWHQLTPETAGRR